MLLEVVFGRLFGPLDGMEVAVAVVPHVASVIALFCPLLPFPLGVYSSQRLLGVA